MDECKKLGIKTSSQAIAENVQKVMEFFFLGKSHSGKIFSLKSCNKIIPNKVPIQKSQLLEDIENFSDERVEQEGPMVVSCDGKYLAELSEALKESYLVVPASDLNSCSFAKGLSSIMLQDRCTIFFETSGLRKTGTARLKLVLEGILSLFDNRVRIVLYGKSCLEELCEKRFEKTSSFQNRVLLSSTPENNPISSPFFHSELKVLQDEVRKLKLEKLELENSVKSLHEHSEALKIDHTKLETKVNEEVIHNIELKKERDYYINLHKDAEKLCSTLKLENEQLKAKTEESRIEYEADAKDKKFWILALQVENESMLEKLQNIRCDISRNQDTKHVQTDNIEMEDKVTEPSCNEMIATCESGRKALIDNQCQTKKVIIADSYPTYLIQKIENDPSYAYMDKVDSCIKNLSYTTEFIKKTDTDVCCQVKITKGSRIIEYQNLLNFEGEGTDIFKAKEDAFKAFISALKDEAEKTI